MKNGLHRYPGRTVQNSGHKTDHMIHRSGNKLYAPESSRIKFSKKKLLIFLFHFTGLFSQNFEAIVRFRRGSAGY